MRYLILSLFIFFAGCEGCGYTSVDNKMTGQVKKIHHNTPLLCGNYNSADVSLGIMQNGAGSISNHDISLTVEDPAVLKTLEEAAMTGKLVEVTFKERRVVICIDEGIATEARLLSPSVVEVDVTKPAAEPKTVKMALNGHAIVAVITGGKVINLKLDDIDTALDSAAGKAAIRVVLATEAP